MKAYWIAHVDISDPTQYAEYTRRAPAAFEQYGGKFLARGGRGEALEGRTTPQRTVIIEFESYDQARACYHSSQYQEALSHRKDVAHAEIVIVEAFAG